ncbi:hypothetical protein DFJ74DRAFT_402901 [Hyaloraphidium curvatum]|nr:hypothetical protein DFJ74DRAFT_402901 [Hyaloraphidium curvatum]
MGPLASLAAVGTALLALAGSARGAFDFTGYQVLPTLVGCPSGKPGTLAPQVDTLRTNMTAADLSFAAYTKPVDGRKMVLYLGRNSHRAECFANSVGNQQTCHHDFFLRGSWRGLRECNWDPADTTSRPGYEVRNNSVYIEWQDPFPDGTSRTSRYAYPVSIALPTTVNVQASVKILEESGIKNFNLTGLSYDVTDGQRFIILDFTMFSRWPNNLTLDADSGYVQLPGFPGSVEVVSYTLPTCVKTDGSSSTAFTTQDFCYQNGQLRIAIGDRCNVGGIYSFNFDTNCFPGAANVQDCSGRVLTANALIGTPNQSGALELDLCNALVNTVAAVTGEMVADKPEGYFFGDTVLLAATFTSPDLPIYEARLTKMILGRNKVQRTPNIGAATNVTRNVNTTLVDSAAGPAAVGALSTLAVNTNFTYLPTANPNVVEMKVTPNMLPAQAGVDFNDNSFLTTDDFDSITDYTFYATFRIYFDQQSAAGQRRRRLLARDLALPAHQLQEREVRVPAPGLRRTSAVRQEANAALTVPRNPNAPEPVPTQEPVVPQAAPSPAGPPPLAIAAVVVGSVALLSSCAALLVLLSMRRRKGREEEEDRRRLLDGFKATAWGPPV